MLGRHRIQPRYVDPCLECSFACGRIENILVRRHIIMGFCFVFVFSIIYHYERVKSFKSLILLKVRIEVGSSMHASLIEE